MKVLQIFMLSVFGFILAGCPLVAAESISAQEGQEMLSPRIDVDAQLRELRRSIDDLSRKVNRMDSQVDRLDHDMREIKNKVVTTY